MQLTALRPRSRGPAAKPRTPGNAPAPVRDRARRSSGPQDRALYACSCGFAFKASVTTTVGCPHCGQTQAW
jgi:hypothetical protein